PTRLAQLARFSCPPRASRTRGFAPSRHISGVVLARECEIPVEAGRIGHRLLVDHLLYGLPEQRSLQIGFSCGEGSLTRLTHVAEAAGWAQSAPGRRWSGVRNCSSIVIACTAKQSRLTAERRWVASLRAQRRSM